MALRRMPKLIQRKVTVFYKTVQDVHSIVYIVMDLQFKNSSNSPKSITAIEVRYSTNGISYPFYFEDKNLSPSVNMKAKTENSLSYRLRPSVANIECRPFPMNEERAFVEISFRVENEEREYKFIEGYNISALPTERSFNDALYP